MKNKIFTVPILIGTIALLTFTFISQTSFAGGETKFGPVVGANMATVAGDNTSDASMKIGLHVGFVVDLGLSDNLFIEPGVIYSMKGDQSKADSKFKINLN